MFPENMDKTSSPRSNNTCVTCVRKVTHLEEHFMDEEEKKDSQTLLTRPTAAITRESGDHQTMMNKKAMGQDPRRNLWRDS